MNIPERLIPNALHGLVIGAGLGAVAGVVHTYRGKALASASSSTEKKQPEQKTAQQDRKGLLETFQSMSKKVAHEQQKEDTSHVETPNLDRDSTAREAMNRLLSYKKHAPMLYNRIQFNLDRLIGIFINLKQNIHQHSYGYKTMRYRMSIQQDMKQLKNALRNTSTPHFAEDEKLLLQIVENYNYNINQEMKKFLYKRSENASNVQNNES